MADSSAPVPEALTVHAQSRVLEVVFAGGEAYRIPFELLRVYSPSAEVQGHGPGQDVTLVGLEPVGHYAVKPVFSDGHDSGIFTWAYLHELGRDQAQLWQRYLQRLQDAGADRDAPMAPRPHKGGGCGSH